MGLALLYYLAARLGMLMEFAQTHASPVWPPTGIALAAVLVAGQWVWPGVFVGAAIANIAFAYLHQPGPLPPLTPLGHLTFAVDHPDEAVKALAIGVGNTLEATVGAYLTGLWAAERNPFQQVRDVGWFSLALVLCCAVGATIGVTSVCLAGAPWVLFSDIWFTWWLGDVAGGVILVPLLVMALCEWPRQYPTRRALELTASLAMLVFILAMTFLGLFHVPIFRQQAYLLLPILMLFAFRFGRLEAAFAVVVVSCFAVFGTWSGSGPFVRGSAHESFLLLVGFVAVAAVTIITLAATLEERRRLSASLELRVAQRTAALVRSNEDLERFAYAASHDLKAPLRVIDSLACWVEEDLGDDISEESKVNLVLLRKRVERMGRLINGLLQYSRANRQQGQAEIVNVEELIRDVCDMLRTDSDSMLQLERPMPQLRTERAPLKQVFLNLIGNALKHHDDPARARIRIFCVDDGGPFVTFHVVDNGPGIPSQYHTVVFTMFKTLRSQDEVEGSGIGLALVQRLVHGAGGELSLRNAEGRGAEFVFSWPRDASARPSLVA